jgi:hypothetical protein
MVSGIKELDKFHGDGKYDGWYIRTECVHSGVIKAAVYDNNDILQACAHADQRDFSGTVGISKTEDAAIQRALRFLRGFDSQSSS